MFPAWPGTVDDLRKPSGCHSHSLAEGANTARQPEPTGRATATDHDSKESAISAQHNLNQRYRKSGGCRKASGKLESEGHVFPGMRYSHARAAPNQAQAREIALQLELARTVDISKLLNDAFSSHLPAPRHVADRGRDLWYSRHQRGPRVDQPSGH